VCQPLCNWLENFLIVAVGSKGRALKRQAESDGVSIATGLMRGNAMSTMEITEGVDLHNLIPGSLVDVETTSRHYYIECLGGKAMRISGHPRFCPNPVEAELQGSVDRDGVCANGLIIPGKYLVFVLDHDLPITTSKVVSVHVDEPRLSGRIH
jgi:hypothetical protein